MSSANGFSGQQPGWAQQRPGTNPASTPDRTAQAPAPSAPDAQWWQQQAAVQAQQLQNAAAAGQQPAWPAPQPGYGQNNTQQAAQHGQHQAAAQHPSHAGYQPYPGQSGGAGYPQQQPAYRPQQAAPSNDPYAPRFEPYGQTGAAHDPQTAGFSAARTPTAAEYAAQAAAAAQGYGRAQPTQQPAPSWPGQQPQAAQHQAQQPQPTSRGYDIGSYAPHAKAQSAPQDFGTFRTADPALSRATPAQPALNDWQGRQQTQPGAYAAPAYQQPTDELGFAQAAGGELEAGYGDEELEYDYEEPSRPRRPFMIAAALAGAIMVGGGLAYGYKTILGGASGEPPMIRSADAPSKMKPADAGGKQFAHSDSKIMGRLGEGTAAGGAATLAATTDADASGSDVDAGGTRKVSTLVVGRDGSIQAPAAIPASADSGVPGMTVVDALGQQAAPPEAPAVVNAPAEPEKRGLTRAEIAAVAPQAPLPAEATGSIEADPDSAPPPVVAEAPQPPPVAKAKPKKVAALAPPASDAYNPSGAARPAAAPVTATAPSGGANGYVAVLASVPRSTGSRMEALKRFADMQQKYTTTLAGKTPDVAEANLGAKGDYHRLVVGPPASREQASALCTQLKAQGHADCWVTSY